MSEPAAFFDVPSAIWMLPLLPVSEVPVVISTYPDAPFTVLPVVIVNEPAAFNVMRGVSTC